MTDNYFEENNKFFGLRGILGRRNFIVNVLIIEIIESLLWTTPFIYLMMFNPEIMSQFTSAALKSSTTPLWTTLWVFITGLISTILFFPSIVRRVRDIIGEVDDNRVYLVASVLSVLVFMGYTPVGSSFFGNWLSFFIILILIFTKGKITGQKPKNNLLKFNWGAFLGTWIWGLFNSAPITLLMLPLCLTFGWFPFMLICGIKGNEWAMNEKYDNIDTFHKSQEKQTVIWAALTPFLVVLCLILSVIISSILLANYSKTHPDYQKKLESLSARYQEAAVKSNFTKIELTDNEYKFYIEPEIWKKLARKYRKQMLSVAANYVLTTNKDFSITSDSVKYIEVLNKTKIYSSFNNEPLGEFYINPEEYAKNIEEKKFPFALMDKGYQFNDYPTLP